MSPQRHISCQAGSANFAASIKAHFLHFKGYLVTFFRERIGRNSSVFIEQGCLSVDSSSSWHGFSTVLPLL